MKRGEHRHRSRASSLPLRCCSPRLLARLRRTVGLVDPCAWTDGQAFADLNGAVRTLPVFDDGSGPALYASGMFTAAGGERASHVAR